MSSIVKDRNNIINEFRNRTKFIDDSQDQAIINKDSKTSLSVKSDGNTTLAAGKYAQFKVEEEQGIINSISLQDTTCTVQKHINARDININNHKLNSQLYELTDFKKMNNGAIVGDLNISGTVLVKAWEPNLNKWVLIRRQIRTPMFSNLLNIPCSHEQMEVEENITDDIRQKKINADNKE